MAQTYKFGNGTFATKEGSLMSYNDEGGNFKPLPFSFSRDSIGTRVNKEGLIEVVGKDIPRIDYKDSADGVLLLENSATNLVTYSEDFSDSSWIKNNVNLTSGFISPDGTANAFKLTSDLTNDVHRIRISSLASGLAANSQFTYSFFIKKAEVKWFLLKTVINTQSVTVDVWFDLENGVIGTESNGVGKIEDYGNDWYRCSINIVTNSSATSLNIYGYLADENNSETYQGDGTSGLYIWGAQVEANSIASSYIPTSGSTVQRAAETANGSGNSEVFNDSSGVLFADISTFKEVGSSGLISLSDETISNRLTIELDGNIVKGRITPSVGILNSSTNITIPTKVALKYKENDFALWVNGFEAATINSGNTFSNGTLTELAFDRGDAAEDFYGKTKEIGYYNEILTDEELETLTSYRSLNELVTELNLNTL